MLEGVPWKVNGAGRREALKTPWRSRGDCFVAGFLEEESEPRK
jgi:hypothetical protein